MTDRGWALATEKSKVAYVKNLGLDEKLSDMLTIYIRNHTKAITNINNSKDNKIIRKGQENKRNLLKHYICNHIKRVIASNLFLKCRIRKYSETLK